MLKLSTKGRYGLRAMLDLARAFGQRPVPMSEIAERQGLSRKYLHSLLAALKDAGLVRSIRGAHGGYELARAPAEIEVSDVMRATEGELSIVDCVSDKDACPRTEECEARRLWGALNEAMERVLDGLTLDDLAEGRPIGTAETVRRAP
jgi:Rrf2 family protein